MNKAFTEIEDLDPTIHERWLKKHDFKPDASGAFLIDKYKGKDPVTRDDLFANIKENVSGGEYTPLYTEPYDERTFVMICGGPSIADHLEEIREKSLRPDKYFVVCSNMTGGYLLERNIVPHVHFILDPTERKKLDVAVGKTSKDIQYWINVACHPAVFGALKEQGIKPYAFLADFDADGKAVQTVKQSMTPGQPGMMAIQGGTMAGLRALNLADALGFRDFEYYGFDAAVRLVPGGAQPYAYEKKRGEAIIEVSCDRCDEKFNTTLVFQKQVNEFIQWRHNLAGMNIRIIGGGLVAHYLEHIEHLEGAHHHGTQRFTEEYAKLQQELHAAGHYGVTGQMYMPTIFHAISQLAKLHGAVSVLDYGSAQGSTMKVVRDHFWFPPDVEDHCYDPFVPGSDKEPEPADLVICTDVMEHVEPQCTKAVLDHIASLTKRIAFFSISMRMANKSLSDGRNAHVNIRDTEFWLREMRRRFIMSEAKVSADGDTLLVIGQAIADVREITQRRRHAGAA